MKFIDENAQTDGKRQWTETERSYPHSMGLHNADYFQNNWMQEDGLEPPVKRVANERERTRTASVNDAFTLLRNLIPTNPINRKLSKIETLRLASSYISHLHAVLVTGIDPADQPCLRHQQLTPPGCVTGGCPISLTDQFNDQHRSVCTFCVTEMKQQQNQKRSLTKDVSLDSESQ